MSLQTNAYRELTPIRARGDKSKKETSLSSETDLSGARPNNFVYSFGCSTRNSCELPVHAHKLSSATASSLLVVNSHAIVFQGDCVRRSDEGRNKFPQQRGRFSTPFFLWAAKMRLTKHLTSLRKNSSGVAASQFFAFPFSRVNLWLSWGSPCPAAISCLGHAPPRNEEVVRSFTSCLLRSLQTRSFRVLPNLQPHCKQKVCNTSLLVRLAPHRPAERNSEV